MVAMKSKWQTEMVQALDCCELRVQRLPMNDARMRTIHRTKNAKEARGDNNKIAPAYSGKNDRHRRHQ